MAELNISISNPLVQMGGTFAIAWFLKTIGIEFIAIGVYAVFWGLLIYYGISYGKRIYKARFKR